jgi:hypothetical protein
VILASQGPPIAGPDTAVDGADFILDQPTGVPAIWGRGSQVLWAPGEALMIAGGQGLGKTTLAGLLMRALLGLVGAVLGLPVTDSGCKILYLAMDRPSQIARSMARQFGESDREVLAERVKFWKGPPPRDFAASPTMLARIAEYYGAGVVFVDSLKDAAVRLSEDSVGAQYNRARQHRQRRQAGGVMSRGFNHASITLDSKRAGRVIHAGISCEFNHESNTSFTETCITAGRVIHAVNHGNHGPVIHETHSPFRDRVSDDNDTDQEGR